jgi:hypothetical protein
MVTLYIKDVVAAIDEELICNYSPKLMDLLCLCEVSVIDTIQVSLEDFDLFKHSFTSSK